MKRLGVLIIIFALLCGCSVSDDGMERVLQLRSQMDQKGCQFDAVITADYGDAIYKFTLRCVYMHSGSMAFSVIEPESIAGISGTVEASGGKLQFDDSALAFALLADGQLSPVSGPWVVLKALHSGYITSCGRAGELLRATIKDSYADDALTVDIWLTQVNIPVRGEILWDNRRILTVELENFTME